ncbi:hypothetical protein RQP46_011306 [Phenoliferia psychrophenolica]
MLYSGMPVDLVESARRRDVLFVLFYLSSPVTSDHDRIAALGAALLPRSPTNHEPSAAQEVVLMRSRVLIIKILVLSDVPLDAKGPSGKSARELAQSLAGGEARLLSEWELCGEVIWEDAQTALKIPLRDGLEHFLRRHRYDLEQTEEDYAREFPEETIPLLKNEGEEGDDANSSSSSDDVPLANVMRVGVAPHAAPHAPTPAPPPTSRAPSPQPPPPQKLQNSKPQDAPYVGPEPPPGFPTPSLVICGLLRSDPLLRTKVLIQEVVRQFVPDPRFKVFISDERRPDRIAFVAQSHYSADRLAAQLRQCHRLKAIGGSNLVVLEWKDKRAEVPKLWIGGLLKLSGPAEQVDAIVDRDVRTLLTTVLSASRIGRIHLRGAALRSIPPLLIAIVELKSEEDVALAVTHLAGAVLRGQRLSIDRYREELPTFVQSLANSNTIQPILSAANAGPPSHPQHARHWLSRHSWPLSESITLSSLATTSTSLTPAMEYTRHEVAGYSRPLSITLAPTRATSLAASQRAISGFVATIEEERRIAVVQASSLSQALQTTSYKIWEPMSAPPTPTFSRELLLQSRFGYVHPSVAMAALQQPKAFSDEGKEQRYESFLKSNAGLCYSHFDALLLRVEEFNKRNRKFTEVTKRLCGIP